MFSWYKKKGEQIIRCDNLFSSEKEAWRDAYQFDDWEYYLVNEEKCTEKNVKTPYQMMSRFDRYLYRASLFSFDSNGSITDVQKHVLKYIIKEKHFIGLGSPGSSFGDFSSGKRIGRGKFTYDVLYDDKETFCWSITNIDEYRDNSVTTENSIYLKDKKVTYRKQNSANYLLHLNNEEITKITAYIAMMLDDDERDEIMEQVEKFLKE